MGFETITGFRSIRPSDKFGKTLKVKNKVEER
jgi:hypothetical protein